MMNEMPKTRAEQALVLAAFGRREQVADDGERDREERAGAEALDAAEQDQLPHGLAQAGQRRADEEQGDADHQHRPAAEDVGQLAVERHGDRAGQQVDRDDPRVQLVAAEVGDDLGQCRSDDRLVEGAEEQPEQDRAEDLDLRAPVQPERRVLRECRSGALDGAPSIISGGPFLQFGRSVGDGPSDRTVESYGGCVVGVAWPCRGRPRASGPSAIDQAPPRDVVEVRRASRVSWGASSWPRIAWSRSCLKTRARRAGLSPRRARRTSTTRRSSGTRTRSTSRAPPSDRRGRSRSRATRRAAPPSGSSSGSPWCSRSHMTCRWVMLTPAFTRRSVPAHRSSAIMRGIGQIARRFAPAGVQPPGRSAPGPVRDLSIVRIA